MHGNAANGTCSATIGGSAGTVEQNSHGSTQSCSLIARAVSAGTYNNVTVSYSAALGTSIRHRIDVYLLVNYKSATPFASNANRETTTATTITLTCNTPAGGVALFASQHAVATGGIAWNNAAEDNDVIINAASQCACATIASTTSETPHSETTTANSGSRRTIVGASWENNVIAYTIVSDQGSFTLTGQAALKKISQLIANGSFTLSGQAALQKITKTASQGSFTLSGQDILQKITKIVAYGAFTLTGQSIAFLNALLFGVDKGNFTLSGQDAGFLRGLKMMIANGAFVLTGQNATLKKALKFAADYGAFVLSGQAVEFVIVTAAAAFRALRRVLPFPKVHGSVSLRDTRDTEPKLRK